MSRCLIPTQDIEKTRDDLLVEWEVGREELLQSFLSAFLAKDMQGEVSA